MEKLWSLMKHKRIFTSLAFLIACIFFIITLGTGCCFGSGKNSGNNTIDKTSVSSDTAYEGTDEATAGSETSDSISSTSNNSTTKTNIAIDDTSTTDPSPSSELTSTTINADNTNLDVSLSENEIQISFDMDYIINISGDVSNVNIISIIPRDYKDRQRIINSEYSLEPVRIFDDGLNTYAEFNIDNPVSGFEINIMDEIILSQYGLDTAFSAGNKDFDIGNLDNYLRPEQYIESDDEDIKNTARSFEGEDLYALVSAIYGYVMDNMEWIVYVPEDVGAKAAFMEKQGDCTSYSDLFIALLRAYGIPARMIEGYTINTSDLSEGHNWVEVYFNDIGWVPFDPTFDDNNGSTSLFNNLNNIYVYFSLKRNDSVLGGFHYYIYNWYGDGSVDIVKNISVK